MEEDLLKDMGMSRIGMVRIYDRVTGKFVRDGRRMLWAFETHFFVRDRHGTFYKLDTSKYLFELV